MARTPPKQPLVAIIGATGTGKSQLAVEIAKRHNGEIINGDAMQLYDGLPIITNKITENEKHGVPHHLLGAIGIHEQTWVVGKFVQHAVTAIEGIRSRGRLPILVGGTHYYTQSLLFRDGLADQEDEWYEVAEVKSKWPILEKPTERLLEELRKVDPVMANRWHPNDRRKISRSLEIYLRTGRKASEVYAEQRQARPVSCDPDMAATKEESLSMRYPTLLFWIHADHEVLKQRLDARVDKMLASGLLDEISLLNSHIESESASANSPPFDETRGIWVSIGYKEFKPYISALQAGTATAYELERLKHEAVEKTKAATRQYSKRQLRWIRIKLLHSLIASNALKQLYLLDGTDTSLFSSNVISPALELTEQWLQGAEMPTPGSLCTTAAAAEMLRPKREYDLSANPEKWMRRHCEVCGVTSVTAEQWLQHERSKAHKKLASKRRKTQGEQNDRSRQERAVNADAVQTAASEENENG